MPEKILPYDCPKCGELIPEGDYDTYTVGTIDLGYVYYPHSLCPHCGECIGCEDDDYD